MVATGPELWRPIHADMDKKSLESSIGPMLVAVGFKKKASTWYRETEGSLQVVDLQKSAYGLQFYLNLCCVPKGMYVEGMPTPKEHKCPIRVRLADVYPERGTQVGDVFDLERAGVSDVQRREQLNEIINKLVLPFFERTASAHALRDAIRQGLFKRGAVSLATKMHLGIADCSLPPAFGSEPPPTTHG